MATLLDFAPSPKREYPAGPEQIYRLAGEMSQDGDFVLARRFDRLSLFSILCHQQRLFFLEKKLERLKNDKEVVDFAQRDELVKDVQQTVKAFNKAVLAQSAICNMSSPPRRVRENVLTLIRSNDLFQSVKAEFGSLTEDNNHITFTQKPKPWLHRLIDSTPWLRRFYRVPNPTNPDVELWSEEKISRHLGRAVILLFSAVAFGTIFALLYVCERWARGAIIVASTGLVIVLIALFMNLRSHEVVAIIIGYTAILVNIPCASK